MCPAVPTMMWGIDPYSEAEAPRPFHLRASRLRRTVRLRAPRLRRTSRISLAMIRRRSCRPLLTALLGVWAAVIQPAAQTAAPDVSRTTESAGFREAKAFIRTDYDRFVKELIALTEIPAPPFK